MFRNTNKQLNMHTDMKAISPTSTDPKCGSKCAPQIVALPLVSFSTSVLQRCKQPSRTDSSSSVMCLGAGCIGRSGGIRDCVNGLCITDLCTGDVLGTSEDEGPCCSTVLHSLTREIQKFNHHIYRLNTTP